jgi:hypothetical protein
MTQRVTRDQFEQRFRQRVEGEQNWVTFLGKQRGDVLDKVHQETDARALQRQQMARQRIADEEYAIAKRLYDEEHERELRDRVQSEQDAIAQALHDQISAETRDEKIRGVLRENDPEYRELKSKLQLALVTQTRDNQRREAVMRRQLETQERLETEEEMLRWHRRREEERRAEEDAKHQESLATRAVIQEQLRDKERRRQLLEVAQAERDKQQVEETIRRIADEDAAAVQATRMKQAKARQEMIDFMKAREEMKAEERRIEEEENQKMKAFSANIDERLARAKADAERRERDRAALAEKIALDIRKKKDEAESYENLCLELAQQQELQRIKEREEAEQRKIEQQHEDCRRFMQETFRARAIQLENDKVEERKLKLQIEDQQQKIAELAEIEQEQNRIRTEKFRRELSRQLVQKKEMFETARQEELRKLRLEQEREDERQRILNEERRKLVINHILSMGPEAVHYLPKGVLKEDDLNYLPEDYRNAILSQRIKRSQELTRPPASTRTH